MKAKNWGRGQTPGEDTAADSGSEANPTSCDKQYYSLHAGQSAKAYNTPSPLGSEYHINADPQALEYYSQLLRGLLAHVFTAIHGSNAPPNSLRRILSILDVDYHGKDSVGQLRRQLKSYMKSTNSDVEFGKRVLAFLDDTNSNAIPEDPDPNISVPSDEHHPCPVRGILADHDFMSTERNKDLRNVVLQCHHAHSKTCFKYWRGPPEPKTCRFDLHEDNVWAESSFDPEAAVKKLGEYNPSEDHIATRAKKLLQKCAYAMISQQELSRQQVSSYLLDFEEHFTSHSYRNFYWTSFESFINMEDPSPECYPAKTSPDVGDHSGPLDSDLDDELNNPGTEEIDNEDEIRVSVDGSGNLVPADYQMRGNELQSACVWDFMSRVDNADKAQKSSRKRWWRALPLVGLTSFIPIIFPTITANAMRCAASGGAALPGTWMRCRGAAL
ncbi:hypothetical protein DFH08DRAFT_1039826 [Mycena albidolilacea]|uniref:Uncharacterized protein n=1 Tax=Mycena albidolilacea TaxID=1033008 RepID=A0AAD6ZC82_9AGAR|nr:hypothetical protein DFH08DRAFT_1039826 [Mycena albidolilacea]